MSVTIPNAVATSANVATTVITALATSLVITNPETTGIVYYTAYRSPTASAVSITRVTQLGQDLKPIGHVVGNNNTHLTAYYAPFIPDPDNSIVIVYSRAVSNVQGRIHLAGAAKRNPIQEVRTAAGSGTATNITTIGVNGGAILSIIAAIGTDTLSNAIVGTNFTVEDQVTQTSASLHTAIAVFDATFPGNITATWASMSATSNFVHMTITVNPYRGSM